MPMRPLLDFLNRHQVKYVTISHSPAYTAQEFAASAHILGQVLAKTVIVQLDGTLAMVVLPAPEHIDFDRLTHATSPAHAELASEQDFQDRFPECEVGAMPLFGNLYRMEILVATRLAEDAEIAFNAGDHTELMRMAYRDFDRLVRPKVGLFSSP